MGLHPIDMELASLEGEIQQAQTAVEIRVSIFKRQRDAFEMIAAHQRNLRERHRRLVTFNPVNVKLKQTFRKAIRQAVITRQRSRRRLITSRNEVKKMRQTLAGLKQRYNAVLSRWEQRLEEIETIDRQDPVIDP